MTFDLSRLYAREKNARRSIPLEISGVAPIDAQSEHANTRRGYEGSDQRLVLAKLRSQVGLGGRFCHDA